MAQVDTIDSNSTGLRYSEESAPGTAGSIWYAFEPNSYGGFGATIKTVARTPIAEDRQMKRGVAVDKDVAGAFNNDVTQTNLRDILQGYFFAAIRTKNATACATVTGSSTDDYTVASALGSNFRTGDLFWASGFDDSANNGLKECNGSTTTTVSCSTDLTTASTQEGTLVRVGFHFAAGDLEMNAAGTLPVLTSTTKDFTQLGLLPGEWIYIGGDTAGTDQFFTAANNGFARVRLVAAHAITLDKMEGTAVTDDGSSTGSGGTDFALKIFFPARLLKNESDPTYIVTKTYQLERSLGVPNSSSPTQIQSEYLVGSYCNEITFNLGTADKITADLSFLSINHEVYTGAEGRKAGSRPDIEDTSAYDTTNAVSFAKLALVSSSVENPTALFVGIEETKVTINNNLQANKAIGYYGNFAVSKGFFQVSGSMTAYFNNVSAISSVIDNEMATFHYHLVKENTATSFDLPLITLGDGSPNVELNNPIKIPLTFMASKASEVYEDFDHTMMMCFWDYIPTAAAE